MLRCYELGLNLSDLMYFDEFQIYAMITERSKDFEQMNNDGKPKKRRATQADFDAFGGGF